MDWKQAQAGSAPVFMYRTTSYFGQHFFNTHLWMIQSLLHGNYVDGVHWWSCTFQETRVGLTCYIWGWLDYLACRVVPWPLNTLYMWRSMTMVTSPYSIILFGCPPTSIVLVVSTWALFLDMWLLKAELTWFLEWIIGCFWFWCLQIYLFGDENLKLNSIISMCTAAIVVFMAMPHCQGSGLVCRSRTVA